MFGKTGRDSANIQERKCCRIWREGRARLVNIANAINELSGGNPRVLLIFYDELKRTGLSADDICDIFNREAECPHY